MERLTRASGVTEEVVISRYDRADPDGDEELSWTEPKPFQKDVYRNFRYESNDSALRPGDPRFAASGTFVPVDYNVVGGLTDAVSPGSRVTDVAVPREW